MLEENPPGSFAQQNEEANHGVYEPGSFGEQNAEANRLVIPDVDPVYQAIATMRRKAAINSVDLRGLPPPNREHEFDGRITNLEELMTGTLAALNSASITAVCNGDGTITITLTLPSLPG